MILQFPAFELDFDRVEQRQAGRITAVEPKMFSLLCLLAENPDRVVSREEMIAQVWGGRFILDAAVATALKQVRMGLGDDGGSQQFVRMVRGRGQRFAAPVRIAVPARASAAPGDALVQAPRGKRQTVAVLPFRRADVSGKASTPGDAIPTEVISSLSRLRWLRVIARESTFRSSGSGARGWTFTPCRRSSGRDTA